MKTIEIKGHLRGSLGSKFAKQQRREGQVPCVVYGGPENRHFNISHQELQKVLYTPHVYLVKLDIDDTRVDAVVRDAQFHPVTDQILHVDFSEVTKGKPVSIQLPVVLKGSSEGVRGGGSLRQNAKKLRVLGEADNLPDDITLDITKMKIGDMIKVGDLSLKGVEIQEAANRVIVSVRTSRKAVVEEETPAAAAEGTAATPAEAPKAE